MSEIPFASLLSALALSDQKLRLGTRLKIADDPNPFVAPTLQILGLESVRPLDSEVLFIKASAAVGKSTIAQHLSHNRRIPLLDLSKVPVSTGSLKALLFDVAGIGDPLQAFHAGKLPIIVDALDEGRLLSGEQGFESFLETTGELLNEDRSTPNRPKLIFLGRYDSTEIAEVWLGLSGRNVTSSNLEVGFFGRDAAWNLIQAYADLKAAPNAAYRQHPEPVHRLIQSYFEAIESALGLGQGTLWTSNQGKAFAGYAPVLAAVGSLLANLENFQELTNRLQAAGAKEAWGVIDTVLNEIIDREQSKFVGIVRSQLTSPLPSEAYDMQEQLTLLSQFVHGQPLNGSGRVRLGVVDQAKYLAMVKANIPEHPFVRSQNFGNAVLGSVVIAHAIERDLLANVDLERTKGISRQPFLWRAISQRLNDESLIDGTYAGFILNSLWNDPIRPAGNIVVRAEAEGEATVDIPLDDTRQFPIRVLTPISFYAQINNCDVDIVGDVCLEGDGPQSATTFYARGTTSLICSAVEVSADRIRFDGDVWFEADRISTSPRLRVYLVNGAQAGWGAQFVERYPWNEIVATLPPPYGVVAGDPLSILINECARRLPPAGTLTLNPDLSVPADDPRVRWIRRQFAQQFPDLLRMMIDHGLASSEPMDASGRGKVRIRFETTWAAISAALSRPESSRDLSAFIEQTRKHFGQQN
jgi:hypothetical protein